MMKVTQPRQRIPRWRQSWGGVWTYVWIALVILAVVGVNIWILRTSAPNTPSQELEERGTSVESEDNSNHVKEDQVADVGSIMNVFTQLYITAMRDNNVDVAIQAREYLTERGKTVVDADGDAWVGLRRFALRLKAPDRIEIGEVTKKTDTFAEVTSTWYYPNTTERYYFYFVVENGKWRIDSIQSVQQ